MKEYDHKKIEKKWQLFWETKKVFQAQNTSKKKKYYSLIEFPYPSGAGMHVGHIRSNTAMDIISRKRRMEGYNVLYPIGWDAFGLPTENYAIKTGIHPIKVTKDNTDTFRRQLKALGFSFDWSREINTTDPKYYKWTQWIFLQFFKKGLAYKARTEINWCPKDKIGLANEEVVAGCCERCGTPVEKREKEQWMLAITKYADRLDKDLDTVDYLEKIKIQQRNWIGKSEGAEIDFKIKSLNPTPALPEGKGENNYLILPGWQSGPNSHFYQWLKKELEPAKVQIVQWSGDATEEWVNIVLNNYKIDENTVIIGHSLGAVIGLKVIEKLNHKIAGLVVVAGFVESKFKDHTRPFADKFNWKFDFAKIKENTKYVKILSDLTDYAVPLDQGKILSENLNAELMEINAKKPHFTSKKEPIVLETIFSYSSPLGRLGGVRGEFGYHTTDTKTWRVLQDRVLEMRQNPTAAEEKLWYTLKGNKQNHHFRRQHIIGNFIVDFVCLEKSLIIEVDGDIHDYQKKEDEERTYFLRQSGFRIIRFHNEEVLNDINEVIEKISKELEALPFGEGLGGVIKVFTTRPDTIFGATFIALAPEVAKKITGKDFGIKVDTDRENKEKIGVDTGLKAKNPANNEMIPVFAVNYVSADYGTGAIMAVPAHDERDFEFAKKYNLRITQVIAPHLIDTDNIPKEGKKHAPRDVIQVVLKHWQDDTVVQLAWKKMPYKSFIIGGREEGETWEEAAKRETLEETGYKNFKSIRRITPELRSEWYAQHKDENRYAHMNIFLIELQDGTREEMSEEEKSKHEVNWIPFSKIPISYHPISEMEYIWKGLNDSSDYAYSGNGILINSGKFSEMDSEKAKKEIIKFVGGKVKTTFKLRDWVFSRQRYWGEPIPLINCPKCGFVPVPEKDLPVVLPKVAKYKPTDNGESPLAGISAWVNVKCPKCKGKAKRETDTMPNWAGSSWYFLRYADTKNSQEFASKKNLKYWTPIDWYNGGMEHTTLHLLYSRFWHKFLYDLKLVPSSEPYLKRTSHGMILADDGTKFSKTKGNGVSPEDIVKIYGADSLRLYEMFMGPFDQAVSWSTDGMVGPKRFLEKVWRIAEKVSKFSNKKNPARSSHLGVPSGYHTVQNFSVQKLLHKTIKKVSEDIEEMRFNTAISAMMILATEMEKADFVSVKDFKMFLQILFPFAPHTTEELWSMLGEKNSLSFSKWPKWDASLIKDNEVKIVIQVNGKVRTEIFVQADEDEETVKKQVLQNSQVLKYISGSSVKKVIYVKNRLVNIVI